MKNQAGKLMAILGKAVAGLNDLPALVPTLKAMGARHVKHNVRDEHYEVRYWAAHVRTCAERMTHE